jgi:hypothetical protein
MYMASHELASRFHGIRENLQELKETIANGFLQDAMRLATQVNLSTGQLAAELIRFSK